jgi:cytochrome c biogenesis protein CcmG/thiol:disulfide interchange protein DsbE
MWKRWLPLAVFAALALLLFAGIQLNRVRDPNAIPSPLIGKPLPAFSLPTLHEPSRVVTQADLLGAPYLLNVWGSWCPECRVEHPVIDALARSGRLRVVGYNYKDAPDDAKRWLQQFGDPYALILADEDGRSAIDFGIYGAPETFLVDAQGVVRYKHIGALTPQVIEERMLPLIGQGGAP